MESLKTYEQKSINGLISMSVVKYNDKLFKFLNSRLAIILYILLWGVLLSIIVFF